MKFVKKCIKLIMGFLNAMQEDCVGAYAAQTAYFIMLSFFPFIILLVTLVQYTSLTPADIYKAAQMIFPPSMDSFVLGIIDEVYSKTAVTISLSAIMTAWSAGKGFMGLIQGMNMIYNVEERRNYIILRLQSALYTMVFVVAIILSLVVLVFGNSLHEMAVEYIPILTYVTEIILKMKGMVSVGILAVLFMVLYRFVPNRKVRLIRQAPGAAFAAVCWYVFSIVFSLYVEYSPGLANMYGSLTTIVLVMLWLYFCMYIILIGAEINSYFEDQFRRVSYYRRMLREQKRTWRRRRKREMQRQFLDAIQMMAASLQSGYSVENAVCASAKELEKLYPRDTFIVLEFQNMALQLDRNQSVESLLQDLGERSQVEDLQSFSEVFLTVKRTGGDLLHVIRNTVSCIRQKQETVAEIETVLTGKMTEQKVMSLMPLLILLYVRLTSPEFLSGMYGNLTGRAVMTVCLLIYAVAYLWGKKIVGIEV